MAIEGMYVLSYSNCYANEIGRSCTIEGAQSHIEDILFFLIKELVGVIKAKDVTPLEVRQFAKWIIRDKGHRMTISGVAHWIKMIKDCDPGFTDEIYGFNQRALKKLLNRYIGKQAEWKQRVENTISNKGTNHPIKVISEKSKKITKDIEQISSDLESKPTESNFNQSRKQQLEKLKEAGYMA